MVARLLLASPRGYCAGVERAVETVEPALELYGPPVYVRQSDRPQRARRPRTRAPRRRLRRERGRGAARARRSSSPRTASRRRCTSASPRAAAHDRRHLPARHEGACRRRDGTQRRATSIVLIGHADHEEVVGTHGRGAGPGRAGRDRSTTPSASRYRTPSGSRTHADDAVRRRDDGDRRASCAARFPDIAGRNEDDICYATSNRQRAVKEMLEHVDVVLVIGSQQHARTRTGSSRSRAPRASPAYLIEDESGRSTSAGSTDVETVGLTRGAAPEQLVGARVRLVPRAWRRGDRSRSRDGRRGRDVPPPRRAAPRARARRVADLAAYAFSMSSSPLSTRRSTASVSSLIRPVGQQVGVGTAA